MSVPGGLSINDNKDTFNDDDSNVSNSAPFELVPQSPTSSGDSQVSGDEYSEDDEKCRLGQIHPLAASIDSVKIDTECGRSRSNNNVVSDHVALDCEELSNCLNLNAALSNSNDCTTHSVVEYFNNGSKIARNTITDIVCSNHLASHFFAIAIADEVKASSGETIRPIYVGFRGTNNATDVLTDIQCLGSPLFNLGLHGKVHIGFQRLAMKIPIEYFVGLLENGYTHKLAGGNSIQQRVKLIFTGHSLGGAIAQLVALRILTIPGIKRDIINRISCYSFGSPLIGNQDFVQGIAHLTKSFYMFILREDIVPRLMTFLGSTIHKVETGVKQIPAVIDYQLMLRKLFQAFASNNPEQVKNSIKDMCANDNNNNIIWKGLAKLKLYDASNFAGMLQSIVKEVFKNHFTCDFACYGDIYWINPNPRPDDTLGDQVGQRRYYPLIWTHVPTTKFKEILENTAEFNLQNVASHLMNQYHTQLWQCQEFNEQLNSVNRTTKPREVQSFYNHCFPKLTSIESVKCSCWREEDGRHQIKLCFSGTNLAFVAHVKIESADPDIIAPDMSSNNNQLVIKFSMKPFISKASITVTVFNSLGDRSHNECSGHRYTIKDLLFLQPETMNRTAKEQKIHDMEVLYLIKQAYAYCLLRPGLPNTSRILHILDRLSERTFSSQVDYQVDEDMKVPTIRKATAAMLGVHEMRKTRKQLENTKEFKLLKDLEANKANVTTSEAPPKQTKANNNNSNNNNNNNNNNNKVQDDSTDEIKQSSFREVYDRFISTENTLSHSFTLGQAMESVIGTALKIDRTLSSFIIAQKNSRGATIAYGALVTITALAGLFSGLGVVYAAYLAGAGLAGASSVFGAAGLSILLSSSGYVMLKQMEYQAAAYKKQLNDVCELFRLHPTTRPEDLYYREYLLVHQGLKNQLQYSSAEEIASTSLEAFTAKVARLNLQDSCIQDIKRFVEDVWHIFTLRELLCGEYIIGVGGPNKIGKSLSLECLGMHTSSDSEKNTETVEYHAFPIKECQTFAFLDFPGFSDSREWIAVMFENFHLMADAFVFVYNIIRANEGKFPAILKHCIASGKPVILCMNQADLYIHIHNKHMKLRSKDEIVALGTSFLTKILDVTELNSPNVTIIPTSFLNQSGKSDEWLQEQHGIVVKRQIMDVIKDKILRPQRIQFDDIKLSHYLNELADPNPATNNGSNNNNNIANNINNINSNYYNYNNNNNNNNATNTNKDLNKIP